MAGKESTSIRVEHLSLSFAGVPAVRDLSFEAPAGSFLTLLGPSGCGKSTTLRCLAGLERPDSGRIWCGDRLLAGLDTFLPPRLRGMGMVFQSYAIWPHMSVYKNIAYGLEGRRVGAAEIGERVRRVAEIVGIAQLLERYPSQLSGGQQQRVALARSLVYEPAVLLLDEPLSNLDAKLRDQMRFELAEIQQRLGTTTVYVTHNQTEALAMSDYILMMRDGQAIQFGTPEEIYARPANRYAADFLGEANFFDGVVAFSGADPATLRIGDDMALRLASAGPELAGAAVVAMVRPANVHISINATAHGLPATIEYAAFLGDRYELWLKAGGTTIKAYSEQPRRIGESVFADIDPADIVIVERVLPTRQDAVSPEIRDRQAMVG